MKNWKRCCKEIYQDDDGWWAILKDGYYWGCDKGKVFNGETYEQLCEAAEEIHSVKKERNGTDISREK